MPIRSFQKSLFSSLTLFLLAACSNGTAATPQVIIITTTPVVITATQPPAPPTATPPPSAENLDRYVQDWKVFVEGLPTAEIKSATDPSLDGESLQCSNKGGEPYSNVHCYLNLPPEPDVSSFTLSMSFLFRPKTTCNNQNGSVSTVQALEFSMSNWTNGQRYELALQWQNVGEGAPQWRYWDPHQAEEKRWKPVNTNITQCLDADEWHTLQLEGSTNGINVYYNSFTIDNQTYVLNFSTARVKTPGETDRLAIAVQLDGNAEQTPYDLFIDKVNFTRQGTSTASVDPTPVTDCSQARIDELPLTSGYVDKKTPITWTPSSCPMNVQVYQDGKLLRENVNGDASGTVNLSDIPAGSVEIKIWVPGAGSASDSRTLQIQ